jgi:hypothetical protein
MNWRWELQAKDAFVLELMDEFVVEKLCAPASSGIFVNDHYLGYGLVVPMSQPVILAF